MLKQIDVSLSDEIPKKAMLLQLNLSLQEKLETLMLLDTEIIDLTPEAGLVEEIELVDSNKQGIYAAMISIEKQLSTLMAPLCSGYRNPNDTPTSSPIPHVWSSETTETDAVCL